MSELNDSVISEKDKEIRRLHRCVILMTRRWMCAIDEMYSRLDDVHGLDDQEFWTGRKYRIFTTSWTKFWKSGGKRWHSIMLDAV